jgi:cellulose biosynthesis protein BcsQ
LFRFFRELLQRDAEVVAAFLVGVTLTGVVVWFVRRWIVRPIANAEAAALKTRLRDRENELEHERTTIGVPKNLLAEREQQLRDTRGQADAKIADLSAACEREGSARAELASANADLHGRLDAQKDREKVIVREAKQHIYRHKKRSEEYQRQLESLVQQVREVTDLQGKIWERPATVPPPPFRPLAEGGCPIVAVANLKGGVGKTSLTANFAATLWRRGKRVLVIDLDNQASLTHLCLPPGKAQELRAGGRLVHKVLSAKSDHGMAAWSNVTMIGESGSYLLAASEELADVEEHVKAEWLLNPAGPDRRYVLRAALHDPRIQERFDVILLDCPPRLGTACINALTACDSVLIPVLPDRTSADAVPRLLDWLRRLRERGICPELSILGVVANRTYRRISLIKREIAIWQELRDNNRAAWNADVYHCAHFVPSSSRIADAANNYTFAAYEPDLEPIFTELVRELEPRLRRSVTHAESSRPAAAR